MDTNTAFSLVFVLFALACLGMLVKKWRVLTNLARISFVILIVSSGLLAGLIYFGNTDYSTYIIPIMFGAAIGLGFSLGDTDDE